MSIHYDAWGYLPKNEGRVPTIDEELAERERICGHGGCSGTCGAHAAEVPFRVQEWVFESLAEDKLADLRALLGDPTIRAIIIDTARARFKKGYAEYGSTMYGWDAEERLTNVIEELADAVVYLTSGPALPEP